MKNLRILIFSLILATIGVSALLSNLKLGQKLLEGSKSLEPPKPSPPKPKTLSPYEFVIKTSIEEGVLPEYSLVIWQLESSQQMEPKDNDHMDRGPFQLTKDAAQDMNCEWGWNFKPNVRCGIRYYKHSLGRCETPSSAAQFYNSGRCTRGKPSAYAKNFNAELLKYQFKMRMIAEIQLVRKEPALVIKKQCEF